MDVLPCVLLPLIMVGVLSFVYYERRKLEKDEREAYIRGKEEERLIQEREARRMADEDDMKEVRNWRRINVMSGSSFTVPTSGTSWRDRSTKPVKMTSLDDFQNVLDLFIYNVKDIFGKEVRIDCGGYVDGSSTFDCAKCGNIEEFIKYAQLKKVKIFELLVFRVTTGYTLQLVAYDNSGEPSSYLNSHMVYLNDKDAKQVEKHFVKMFLNSIGGKYEIDNKEIGKDGHAH